MLYIDNVVDNVLWGAYDYVKLILYYRGVQNNVLLGTCFLIFKCTYVPTPIDTFLLLRGGRLESQGKEN